MPSKNNMVVKPIGILMSILLFGIPTMLLYLSTHYGISLIYGVTGIPLLASWFICGGSFVFFPMLIFSLILYRIEGNNFSFSLLARRFRLRKLPVKDTGWALISAAAVAVLTALIINMAKAFIPAFAVQPPFMVFHTLSEKEYWILLIWLPFFLLNILGEELFWRGWILPRQEMAFGKWAWLVNGMLWLMFHIPFGINFLISLVPILFITPYAVQKTKNTSVGIIIHGILNGTGFLAVAFGLV